MALQHLNCIPAYVALSYPRKHDLVAKGAISDATYAKVRDRVVAN